MASTNQSPFYQRAEVRFLNAVDDDERIDALEEMIKECPKHKSSEKMLANLKTRLKKLLEKKEKSKKAGKGGKAGIKKESMQAVLVGFSNSGKSTLLSSLSNAKPAISNVKFSTTHPVIGMMNYQGTSVQLIEIPPIESEYYDKGIVHTADAVVILVKSIEEIEEAKKMLGKTNGKIIIAFNKIDNLSENEKRKLSAKLSSKRYNFSLISAKTGEGLEDFKEKMFKSFNKIRVYTKEPGKKESDKPIIMNPGATLRDVAEKILKGFSENVKETRIWGPSSKFPGQKIGLKHELRDMDIVEFKTR